MNRQAHSTSREELVASAITEVVSELRMVDVCDYVAFIRIVSCVFRRDMQVLHTRTVLMELSDL